ncbi:MAG: hypothetical protein ACRDWE_09625, partial [Acidimicrobiales bacterium]
MGRGIDSLLRRLAKSGLRRAMAGEHWAWFLLAGGAYLLRRVRQSDDKAAKIHLRSGDRYVIEVHEGASRRGEGRATARDTRRPRVVWHGAR